MPSTRPRVVVRRPQGFTLVELLVVIAIIGILSSLLLSSIAGVRFRSKVTQCASNYRQWGIAAQVYASDDGQGRLPAFTFPLSTAARYSELAPWFVANEMGPKLLPYGVEPPLWFCPAREHSYRQATKFIQSLPTRTAGLTMENLTAYWKTQSPDFAIIDHSWWVPRPLAGSPYVFPDPRVLKCRVQEGWPTKVEDPVGVRQPILTDGIFGVWNDDHTALADFGLGHAFPPWSVRNINLLFVDGHVETKPCKALQPQVEGVRGGAFVY